MNESMNFGNIGFSNVTTQKEESSPAFTTNEKKVTEENVEETKVEEKPEVPIEEEQKKDAEAKADFEKTNVVKDAESFSNVDFGPLKKYLDDDDVTDISYSNGGQLWLKTLSKGVYRADQQDVNNALIEKIAFQCSNIMGKTFNMAHPFLDSESAELRMNFVHDSIARNGVAVVFRKTPAKIRLKKEKLLQDKYVRLSIHDFLINCVRAHCNIIVCGETGSGKTELVKYLASHTAYNEKIITIEDTLELHLDRIFPERDIVAMKTNNIASYSDVLVTCMRQNPIWIILAEVRSAEAVMAVRNSISSGHFILSTIHADKAESIPNRMYSLLESNQDVEQFLKTIYRYVQIGVFVRGRYSGIEKRFVREIAGVCEFHITDDNKPEFTNIYLKGVSGEEKIQNPSKYLYEYLEGQGVDLNNLFGENISRVVDDEGNRIVEDEDTNAREGKYPEGEEDVNNKEASEPKTEAPVPTTEAATVAPTTEAPSAPVVETPSTPVVTEAPSAPAVPVVTAPANPVVTEAPSAPVVPVVTATINPVVTEAPSAPVVTTENNLVNSVVSAMNGATDNTLNVNTNVASPAVPVVSASADNKFLV